GPDAPRTSIEALADRDGAPAVGTQPAAGAAQADVAVADVAVADAPQRVVAPPAPAPAAREPVRIHLEGLRARGMVGPNGPATQSSHELRVIKRPLLGNAFAARRRAPVRAGTRDL